MKEILKKENRTTLIVSIICFVLIGIVATYTYSFFAVTKNNSAIIAGEAESLGLTVVVDQLAPDPSADLIPQMDDYITNAITGRQGSCVDDNGNAVCHTYKISVTNANVKTKVNGRLTLDKKQNPNLKWAVYNLDEESVPTLVGNIKKPEDKKIISNEEFTAGETKDFYIVVWISESGMIQTDKGEYSGVIDFATSNGIVTVALDDSGANPPALTNGLIPVMYDEDTSKWVKADILDNTSPYSWYDYNEKKWANAVLVKDSISYSETVINKTNKNVSINNPNLSTMTTLVATINTDIPGDVYSVLTLTFTTGNSGGTLSFEYDAQVDSMVVGSLYFILNGNNTYTSYECANDADEICSITGTYSANLTPNTEYTLKIDYYNIQAWIDDDSIVISNINFPNDLTKSVSISESTYYYDYVSGENVTTSIWDGESSLKLYSSYTITEEGKFQLESKDKLMAFGNAMIGKYMCSDGTTECSELYEVKTVNNDTITSVFSCTYTEEIRIETGIRNDLTIATAGTEIPEDLILAYYVWVPRYKYKVWNINKVAGTDTYGAYSKGIDIVFEDETSSTGTVTCNDYDFTVTDGSLSETCVGTNGVDYYTHPAFTFGEDELTGFWIGKFIMSSLESNNFASGVRVLPNVNSTSGDVVDYYAASKNMQITNNVYGLSSDSTVADSHTITNMEWGAVAYLTHSKYGMCTGGENSTCSVVDPNEDGVVAGGGDYLENVTQSTTGNVYGIYDMNSGGSTGSAVMGIVSANMGSYTYDPAWVGNTDKYTYNDSTAKYMTTYADYTETFGRNINRSRLGDATGEVVVGDGYVGVNSWYDMGSAFPSVTPELTDPDPFVDPWLMRMLLFGFGNSDLYSVDSRGRTVLAVFP